MADNKDFMKDGLQKIDELTKKISGDKNLLASFKSNPAKTLEGILGVDLPDDQINSIIKGIQAKISLDKAGDIAEGLGKLFK